MDEITKAFKILSTETQDLYVPYRVQTIHYIPTAVEFLRKWVNPNVPLIIKGGASHWPALKKWNQNYLSDVLKDKKVTVAVTPTGYADAIAFREDGCNRQEMFVLPEERTITIPDLFAKLKGELQFFDSSVQHSKGIFYLQKQDSNLTKEFPELLADINLTLPWANEAFGAEPNAINLWIGDARSVTSLHKDPFENIYGVVSGWKDFILLPPTDRPWLPYKTLPVGQYKEISPGVFIIEPKTSEEDGSPCYVPWIALNPLAPNPPPSYAHAHPLHVRVEPGDLLYLPSLWYHHVQQSDGCIAVNFWYDMAMDVKFVYFQFLEHLARSQEDHPIDDRE